VDPEQLESRKDGSGAEVCRPVFRPGKPTRNRFIEKERKRPVDEGAGMVIGVELAVLGIEVVSETVRPSKLIRRQRQEPLVRMQVLALVPVDVVEPDGETEDDDQSEKSGRNAVGPEPERGILGGRPVRPAFRRYRPGNRFNRLQKPAPNDGETPRRGRNSSRPCGLNRP
jgi:hypothetical protein